MANKVKCKPCAQKKVVFPRRICFRLDDDAWQLLNASAARVDWESQGHALNASIRRAMLPFKTEDMQLRIDVFEQLVFAKKLTIKRLREAK